MLQADAEAWVPFAQLARVDRSRDPRRRGVVHGRREPPPRRVDAAGRRGGRAQRGLGSARPATRSTRASWPSRATLSFGQARLALEEARSGLRAALHRSVRSRRRRKACVPRLDRRSLRGAPADASAPHRFRRVRGLDSPAMGTRLGVMGGTFDPIHVGHLVTAEEALHQFTLDEVVFVPTGRPWMKEHEVVASAEDRYRMTEIGIAPEPRFRVSRIEVDRGGPTYTVDTLRAMRDEPTPASSFPSSPAPTRCSRSCDWKESADLVRPRTLHRGDAARLRRRAVRRRIRTSSVMQIPALAISSTDIRARVHEGRPIRFLVPGGRRDATSATAGLYR